VERGLRSLWATDQCQLSRRTDAQLMGIGHGDSSIRALLAILYPVSDTLFDANNSIVYVWKQHREELRSLGRSEAG
jgi:hypothetical protein